MIGVRCLLFIPNLAYKQRMAVQQVKKSIPANADIHNRKSWIEVNQEFPATHTRKIFAHLKN
jgi:hypothetical protein